MEVIKYWAKIDGKELGSFHLQELFSIPELDKETFIWYKGLEEWKPLMESEIYGQFLTYKREENELKEKQRRKRRFWKIFWIVILTLLFLFIAFIGYGIYEVTKEGGVAERMEKLSKEQDINSPKTDINQTTDSVQIDSLKGIDRTANYVSLVLSTPIGKKQTIIWDNQQVHIERISKTNFIIDGADVSYSDEVVNSYEKLQNSDTANEIKNTTKYVFVVLEVRESDPFEPDIMKKRFYEKVLVSDILEFENSEWNDNTKYKLLDRYSNDYRSNVRREHDGGNIKNKEVKIFDEYSEASIEREKYLN
ncbi:MAG: DUF4339 domain-containing protein [Flavobacteriales bacterium]|nr:DUF4339 domain-containing protein [Flavobacteriales bacterium]